MTTLTKAETLARIRAIAEGTQKGASLAQIARTLDMKPTALVQWVHTKGGLDGVLAKAALEQAGYQTDRPEMSPAEAWAAHSDTFERTVSGAINKRWRKIARPKGAFCIFHSTDEHVDDNGAALKLIEADIAAAKAMGAVMAHGGDLSNNWAMAGKLAKMWAKQECSAPTALLRAKHFIDIFDPDVWTDGNHEEMNPYLADLFAEWLPKKTLRDYWRVDFVVATPGGRDVRVSLSHKFQKGRSWFHPHHGVIRETLEGEPADIYMEGHLHVSGSMQIDWPERGLQALAVSSGGYKVVDDFAARISRGGKLPKIRGRAHWIVVDPGVDFDGKLAQAFTCPRQAEAYLNGLQNLRAA